ncbi:MAG TPA: periplasmic heavy metal sensor [Rhodobacteraceae bacterium]|nr:periplasmic heavy metal sensor [Paracoccaceae bacterium]
MSDDAIPPRDPSGLTGWMKVLLFSSLAVNLLIVGAVAGLLLRNDPGSSGKPTAARDISLRDMGYGVFGRALSKEDQKKLNRAIRRQARPLAENRRELRRQTQLLVEALRAEPFDPERVREIADQMQTQVLERQRIAQDLLLAHIENMTPREREAYARRLERKLRPKDDRQR